MRVIAMEPLFGFTNMGIELNVNANILSTED